MVPPLRPKAPQVHRRLTLLLCWAACAAGCTASSAEYVRDGDLYSACYKVHGEKPYQRRALNRALSARRDVRISMRLLTSAQTRDLLGVMPRHFEQVCRVLHYRVEARRLAGELTLRPEHLSSATRSYRVVSGLERQELLALFELPPAPQEAPARARMGGIIGRVLTEGALRLLTVGRHGVSDVEDRLHRMRTAGWAARSSAAYEAWERRIVGDPARAAALEKLEAMLEAASTLDDPATGEVKEGHLLLLKEAYHWTRARGVKVATFDTVTRGDDSALCDETYVIRLPDPYDLDRGLEALFSGGPRRLRDLLELP